MTTALEESFGQLGGDFNGDGEIFVQINQYTTGQEDAPEASATHYEKTCRYGKVKGALQPLLFLDLFQHLRGIPQSLLLFFVKRYRHYMFHTVLPDNGRHGEHHI